MTGVTRRQKKTIKVTADEYDYYYYYIVDELMYQLIDYDLDRYLILSIKYLIFVVMNKTVNVNTRKTKTSINISTHPFSLTRIKIDEQFVSLIIDLHDKSFAKLLNAPKIISIIISNCCKN
jgi:hypothetical protein